MPHPDASAIVNRYLSDKKDPHAAFMGQAKAYLWLGAYDQVVNAEDNDTDAVVAWERHPARWRNSPGFKRTHERLGVVTYWRQHGFPPQCRPIGATDFECK
ncbi:MAG: hypothetical protein H0T83_05490 [Chthoniobacterales bacterium]|nr:hypothetical protein [Chthoniobacterales bacterium]